MIKIDKEKLCKYATNSDRGVQVVPLLAGKFSRITHPIVAN